MDQWKSSRPCHNIHMGEMTNPKVHPWLSLLLSVCVWMITESRLKAPSTDTYLRLIWIYTEPFLSGRRET